MTDLTPSTIWRGNPASASHQPNPRDIVDYMTALALIAEAGGELTATEAAQLISYKANESDFRAEVSALAAISATERLERIANDEAETAARIAGDDAGTEGFYNAGPWDASIGRFPVGRGVNEDQGAVQNGDTFRVSVAGTVDGLDFAVDQRIIAQVDGPSPTTYEGSWDRANTVAILADITARVDAISVSFDTVADFFGASLADIKKQANATTGTAYVYVKDGQNAATVDLAQSAAFDTETTTGLQISLLQNQGATSLAMWGAMGDGLDDTSIADTAWATGRADLAGMTVRLEAYNPTTHGVKVHGPGEIETTTINKSVFRIEGYHESQFSEINFSSPNSPDLGGGVNNNHQDLKLGGAQNSWGRDLFADGSDLGFTVFYGPNTQADRHARNNHFTRFNWIDLKGNGMEWFGVKDSSITQSTFIGQDSLASLIGLRTTGYSYAVNEGLFSQAHVANFVSGSSSQQYARGNIEVITVDNCDFGIRYFGEDELVPSFEASAFGNIKVATVRDSRNVANSGSSFNYNLIAAYDCDNGVFQQNDGGVDGLSVGNFFVGPMARIKGSAVHIKGDHNHIDKTILGDQTDTTFGLYIEGDRNIAKVNVIDCRVPVRVNGDFNIVDAVVENGYQGSVIAGDNNTITIHTDGDLVVSGDNNVIIGYVGGTLTNTGTATNLNGVQGRSGSKRYFSQTTDASGYLTLSHNYIGSHTVTASALGFSSIITAIDSDTVTVRLRRADGTAISVATAVSVIDLQIMAR